MSVKCKRPPSIKDDAFTEDEWGELEVTEQFASELAFELSELGAKYQLHPNTAFSLAAGVAIQMLVSTVEG